MEIIVKFCSFPLLNKTKKGLILSQEKLSLSSDITFIIFSSFLFSSIYGSILISLVSCSALKIGWK